MLEQRVKRNGNTFRVLREAGAHRTLSYATFDLGQNPDEAVKEKSMEYWDGAASFEVRLGQDMDTCVRVIEREGERIAEQYEFYYTPYETRKELRLSLEKARKAYGPNAYLITVEWIECRSEPISSRYIYLESKEGEKFYFLRDTIEAMDPDGKRLMDQYVTRLPEDQRIEDYHLAAAPLVRQKYVISE